MRFLVAVAVIALAGCTSTSTSTPQAETDEVVVVTHDSFAMSKKVLREFEQESGLDVTIVQNGDTGQVVNSAILSSGVPQGDVLFGVDNTFLSRAQDADVFVPYQAPGIPAGLSQQAPDVTPIDTGYVCLNYDTEYFADAQPPQDPTDLTKPAYRDLTVVQNPQTSSPGLAFLLSTIATQPNWQDYWQRLQDNGVKVVDDWENAYYQQFSGGSGEGTRPIVVSYSTSPAAEVMFAGDAGPAPTANVDSKCFQQVEYAGVLRGAANEQGARQFIDFMVSRAFQDQIGEQMFVYPVIKGATVPKEFTEYAPEPQDPVVMSIEQIAAGRDEWIRQWSEIMGQ